MKNRNIPFGYCYKNGVVCVHTAEAKILSQIFEWYISDLSLLKKKKKLNEEQVEYVSGISGWNKARLMRIIEDKRYLGSDGYPSLITADTYEKMQNLKCSRNTQKNTDRTADIFKLNLPVICSNCGCEMQRRHDPRYRITERWICVNKECKTAISLSDENLLKNITDTLNTVISHPNIIVIAEKHNEPNNDVSRLNAEIAYMLETYNFSKDNLLKKMIRCISLKYAQIDSEKYIAKRLKTDFEKSSPLSAFSADLCRRTVKSVLLGTDGTVGLILLNNQKIRKEQIA